MAQSLTPFLMFEGSAEAAMRLYVGLFPGATIDELEHVGPGEQGTVGSIKRGRCTIAGQQLLFFDSSVQHDFSFTPALSLFVECEGEAELDSAFAQLADGGAILMPPANYGFSSKFCWVNDRYGVSWQLNLR